VWQDLSGRLLKTRVKTSPLKNTSRAPQEHLKLRAKISRLKTQQERVKISRLKMRVKPSRLNIWGGNFFASCSCKVRRFLLSTQDAQTFLV
jgi:hypothetical protein